MNEIKKYYDNMKPKNTERLAERIISAERPHKKLSAKPFVIAAACAGTVAAGVTGAAATGLININAIFGRNLSADDPHLGESLVVTENDVTWSVSDSDYLIEVLGITGSDTCVMVNMEISRADGTPVSEHFINPTEEKTFVTDGDFAEDIRLNEDGNITIFYEKNVLEGMSGKEIELSFTDLYPQMEFTQRSHVQFADTPHQFKDGKILNEYGTEVLDDLSDIKLLDLDWSVKFTFTPTDTATNTFVYEDFGQTFGFEYDIYDFASGAVITANHPLEMQVETLTLNAFSGTLSGTVRAGEYGNCANYMIIPTLHHYRNKTYLIMEDGSKFYVVLMEAPGITVHITDEEHEYLDFEYVIVYNEYFGRGNEVLDLSKVKGISFCGTEFYFDE